MEEMQEEVFDAYSDLYRKMLEINRASHADYETLENVRSILNNSSDELKIIMSNIQ